jgi:hypothetical protein
MDANIVAAWVEAYIQAWNSNDPADIRQLFIDDAIYSTGPFDVPWKIRDAIIANWLRRKDAPGTNSFRYEVLASTSDQAVVRGWTHYHETDQEYSNIWLIRFETDGRCREFTEWWVARPKPLARVCARSRHLNANPLGGSVLHRKSSVAATVLTECKLCLSL